MMTSKQAACPWFRRPFVLIVLLGLSLRLASAAVNYPMMRWQNDARMAIPAARLLQGKGLSLDDAAGPSAYRPPLYVLWLSLNYAVFGAYARLGPSLLQALISTLNILLLYLVAKRVWQREAPALAAALILAIHPYSIYHDPALYHTFLSTALLLGGFLFLLKALDSARRKDGFWSGICFGLCILVISTIIPFLAALTVSWLVAILWQRRSRNKITTPAIAANGKIFAMFLIGLGLAWSPWIIRNAIAFHRFIPLTTESGVTLWMGNNPESAARLKNRTHEASPVPKGTKFNLPSRYEGCQPADWCQAGISESDESKELTALAMSWISHHRREFLTLTIWRFGGIWSPFLTPAKTFGQSRSINLIITYGLAGWNIILYLLILIGSRLAWQERRRAYPVFAWMLALTGTGSYALFLYYTKYRIPFEALLLPLAGGALAWLYTLIFSSPAQSSCHED